MQDQSFHRDEAFEKQKNKINLKTNKQEKSLDKRGKKRDALGNEIRSS